MTKKTPDPPVMETVPEDPQVELAEAVRLLQDLTHSLAQRVEKLEELHSQDVPHEALPHAVRRPPRIGWATEGRGMTRRRLITALTAALTGLAFWRPNEPCLILNGYIITPLSEENAEG